MVSVPMPNTSEPFAAVDPPAPTAGSSTITPLLSLGRRITEFGTCCARLAVKAVQVVGIGPL